MALLRSLSAPERIKPKPKERQRVPLWLAVTAIVAVLAGTHLRFANLDLKMRWLDETDSTLAVAGTNPWHLHLRGRLLRPSDLTTYLEIQPNTNVVTTVQVLAQTKPHYAPLYFVLARLWADVTGTGVSAMRAFPAAISVLCLPAAYWLALELFETPTVALAFMAFIAVAPIHVVFAQEINRYSLWTFTIFTSSALLLRALKEPTRIRWIAYTLAMIASLYTNLSSALIVLSHAAFIFISHPQKAGGRRRKFCLSMLVCALAMIPWLLNIVAFGQSRLLGTNANLLQHASTVQLFMALFQDATLPFFDGLKTDSMPGVLAGSAVVLIELLSLVFLCRRLHIRNAVFCFTLIGGTLLPILFTDLLFGQCKTLYPRYIFPWAIGIELSVAFALSAHFSVPSTIKRLAARSVFVVLLTGSIISSFVYSESPSWWNKLDAEFAASEKLNHGRMPLWVGFRSSSRLEAITISQRLSPNARLFIYKPGIKIDLVAGYDPVLVFGAFQRREIRKYLFGSESAPCKFESYGWDSR